MCVSWFGLLNECKYSADWVEHCMAMVDGWNWAEKPSEEDLFCDVKKYIKFWAFLRGWT